MHLDSHPRLGVSVQTVCRACAAPLRTSAGLWGDSSLWVRPHPVHLVLLEEGLLLARVGHRRTEPEPSCSLPSAQNSVRYILGTQEVRFWTMGV